MSDQPAKPADGDDDRSADAERHILDLGSGITGAAGGAAIGLLVGGPVGAVLGGVAVPLLTDITHRVLGRREKVRIGALFQFTLLKVEENLKSGRVPRQDGFFDGPAGSEYRLSGEEIMEGVLLATQREPEERKVKYYANLLANIAFDPTVTRADANLLIKTSNGLTYRQLCLLAIFSDPTIKGSLRSEPYNGFSGKPIRRDVISVLQEIFDLDHMSLVNQSGAYLLAPLDVNPSKMTVQATGVSLCSLMELHTIPSGDLWDAAADILTTAIVSPE